MYGIPRGQIAYHYGCHHNQYEVQHFYTHRIGLHKEVLARAQLYYAKIFLHKAQSRSYHETRKCTYERYYETLQHKDRIGILLADARDDVLPGLERNHVPRVAAEAVHADAAPEEEDVRHVGAELGIRVVELHEVRPCDAPRARGDELAVRLPVEPVRMMRLQRRGPARVVRGQVDQEKPPLRVHGADQLLELVERRRVLVELGHRRIDRQEVRRRERATVLAHHRVGRGNGERRQGLDDPEAHRVHDDRQTADDFAERAELPRKNAVDGIVNGLDDKQKMAIWAKYGISPKNYIFVQQSVAQVKDGASKLMAKVNEEARNMKREEDTLRKNNILIAADESRDSDGNITEGAVNEAQLQMSAELVDRTSELTEAVEDMASLTASKMIADENEKQAEADELERQKQQQEILDRQVPDDFIK